MAIKQRYNNSQERLEDKAEKAILPMLEKAFIYELGLRPVLTLDYVVESRICRVDVTFARVGGRLTIPCEEHHHVISYPGYTKDQMSQLVHAIASRIVNLIQDKVNTYNTTNIRGYATHLFHQCLEDEETFLTWIEQCTAPISIKNKLLRYVAEHRHNLSEELRTGSTFRAFAAIASSFSEEYLRDMSDKELEDMTLLLENVFKLQEAA